MHILCTFLLMVYIIVLYLYVFFLLLVCKKNYLLFGSLCALFMHNMCNPFAPFVHIVVYLQLFYVSGVMSPLFFFKFLFSKFVELVCGGSVINGAYPI